MRETEMSIERLATNRARPALRASVRSGRRVRRDRCSQLSFRICRCSDEVRFNYESQGKIRIIRKPSQRYCQDCLQETDESTEKQLKKKHA